MTMKESYKSAYLFFGCVILLYLGLYVFFVGTSLYLDTWSTLELSKTIFSGEFYKFNTYRSYILSDRSAAFPLGHPVILAVTNAVFGWYPLSPSLLNIAFSLGSYWLVLSISNRLNMPKLAGLALAIGLILYPGFIHSVILGGSIPIAIFFVLLGVRIGLGHQTAASIIGAGLFFGAAVLIRFDFLISSWVTMSLLLWFTNRKLSSFFYANFGFLLALTPWVYYSLTFHSTIWVTDNSWVATSALPAHVLDYPAEAKKTLFTDPGLWLIKVITNFILRIVGRLPEYIVWQPLLVVLIVHLGCEVRKKTITLGAAKGDFLTVSFAFLICLMPYVATGYTGERYFTYLLFGITALMVVFLNLETIRQPKPVLYIAAIAFVFLFSFRPLAEAYYYSGDVKRQMAEQIRLINFLDGCHQKELGIAYVFEDTSTTIKAQYGAETGNRTAMLPTNLEQLSPSDRSKFFMRIGPHRMIPSLDITKCP